MFGRNCTEAIRISARGGAYVRPSVQSQEISTIRLGRKRREVFREWNMVAFQKGRQGVAAVGRTVRPLIDRKPPVS